MAKPAKKTAKKSARKSPAKGKVAKPVRKTGREEASEGGKAKKPARKAVAKKQKKSSLSSRRPPSARAQLRRHRPGTGKARPQGGVPVGPRLSRRLQGLWLRGASREPVGTAAARGDAKNSGSTSSTATSPISARRLRADRQLREGLLGHDRRDGEMGREGSPRAFSIM